MRPVCIYVYDVASRRTVYQNRAGLGCWLCGPATEESSPTLESLMHPEDRPRFAEHVDRMKQAGDQELVEFEYRLQQENGGWRWIAGSSAVFKRDAHGNVEQILGAAWDVSDVRQAEERLQRRVRELSVLYEITQACAQAQSESALADQVTRIIHRSLFPDNCGILWVDQERNVVRHDASFVTYSTDSSREEVPLGEGIVGRVAATGMPCNVADTAAAPHYLPFDAGMRSELCVPIRIGNSVVALIDAESRQPGMFGPEDERLLSTIAGAVAGALERLRADQALRNSQQMLAAVMNNIPVGVFWKDRDSSFLGCNIVVSRALGLDDPEQVVGKKDSDFSCLSQEQVEFFVHKDRQIMESNIPEHGIVEPATLADGSTIWVETSKLPLHDAGGNVIGVLGTWQDITHRKRAEDELRGSLREKEALLKEVHHRVKNNLQIISSLLSLQAERIKDPATLEVLRDSQNRVRSMAMIHESLYRSPSLERLDLPAHIESLCSYLFRSYGVDPRRIRLSLELQPLCLGLDQAIPCGLLIHELVSNALKHAFPDGRAGQVTIAGHSQADGSYELMVRDDGVGLPPDLEVFFTGSLGLHLVFGLTNQLKGALAIDRSSGTCFLISFQPHAPGGTWHE